MVRKSNPRPLERVGSSASMASMTSFSSMKDLRLARSNSVGRMAEDSTDDAQNLEYQVTLMYGRYSANLAEFARKEGKRIKDDELFKDELLFSKELQPYQGVIARTTIRIVRPLWEKTFARLGEDWVFLFVLGLLMAILSFLIDTVVISCFRARMYLHNELLADIHWTLQLFAWVLIPTILVIFSAAFCQWLAPSASGSGIPEMKTILRGVILKEYLTWKTLVAKIVGLSTALGSGLPLGKEGPVMHMASIVSTMLMNVLSALKGVVDNEAHQTDLLAAACTMGVAVTYAAPIGGVLFSIEVTAVYFAVRNYWRGFFAASLGATFYRLMYVWFMDEKTITPIFKVEHNYLVPYDVVELMPFMCIGIVSGFAGAGFVYIHRRYVVFIRQNKTIKRLLSKKRLLYPTFVSIFISFTTFPAILGQFMASTVSNQRQILDLFSNVTWSIAPNDDPTAEQLAILNRWGSSPEFSFHIPLFIFSVVSIFETAIASTLPVPSGLLIPLFKVGAAFGRQVGELMYTLYPLGIRQTNLFPIVPGAYAMVGAASFCASLTHTISISVVLFELTGQITYVIPIMIGVLISNCIASLLQPSIYDSVIRIKKLPYLPDIVSTSSDVYKIHVEDIMVRNIKYIWQGITFMDLKKVIKENRKLKHFPIVDKHDTMILLGSIQRIELVRLLVDQISSEKRRGEAKRRHLDALKKKWEEEDIAGLNKGKTRLHYEDELYESSDEEEVHKGGLLGNISKSLSKSLLSLSRFKLDNSPESAEDTVSTHDELDKENALNESNTPPSSPTVNKLKDLFVKTPVERTDSRFSVSKVDVATKEKPIKFTIGHDDDQEDSDIEVTKGSPKSDEGEKETPKIEIQVPKPVKAKKKSKMDLLKETKNKMKNKMTKENNPNPKQKLRLTKSSSLDSLRSVHMSKPQICVDSASVTTLEMSCPGTPSKSILQRRNSFSLGTLRTIRNSSTNLNISGPETSYSTVTSVDTKLRHAIDKVKKMKLDTASTMELKLSTLTIFKPKKKENGKKKEFDMCPEEREEWELEELSKETDFFKCQIDPSPFQLVERTTLLRTHSIFSMLGINHAYVTAIGKLVGVVAIKELRQAIEGQYVGKPTTTSTDQEKAGSPTTPISTLTPSFHDNKGFVPDKGLMFGTSPQRLSAIPPHMAQIDPEAGAVIRRSVSSSQLSPNGFTNR